MIIRPTENDCFICGKPISGKFVVIESTKLYVIVHYSCIPKEETLTPDDVLDIVRELKEIKF
jgi:hypothetical protein